MVDKVTTKSKDPKAQERGKKGWETQLKKIKAKHLEEIKNGSLETTPSNTPEATPITPSNTPEATPFASYVGSTMSNFGVYGALLLIAGGVYYLYTRQKTLLQAPPEPPKKQPKIYME